MRDGAPKPALPSERLDPRVRTLWTIGAALVALAVIGAGAGAILGSSLPAALIAPLGVVVALAVVWVPGLLYERWRYEIRERDVFLSHGVIFHTIALVPFDRIQFVETSQGPIDRRLGLMRLQIRTAGGSETIPGLRVAEAERLREELSRVAGTTSV